jgi:hypothetical protein
MFVREKTARGHTYLYLVESEREAVASASGSSARSAARTC